MISKLIDYIQACKEDLNSSTSSCGYSDDLVYKLVQMMRSITPQHIIKYMPLLKDSHLSVSVSLFSQSHF